MVIISPRRELRSFVRCCIRLLAHHWGKNQGYNLLQAAILESQSSNPESRPFSRQLYLDSVSYLLQGLPSDLSDHEVLHIQRAIPAEIKVAPPLSVDEGHLLGQPQQTSSSKPPSILHRSLASTIVMICVILRLFLPYLKYFAQAAYRYDREHQVSEKMLARGVQATDALGKRALGVASTALGSELVMETVGYCVEGVCGGVTEGLGEGMKAIGAREDLQRSFQ